MFYEIHTNFSTRSSSLYWVPRSTASRL